MRIRRLGAGRFGKHGGRGEEDWRREAVNLKNRVIVSSVGTSLLSNIIKRYGAELGLGNDPQLLLNRITHLRDDEVTSEHRNLLDAVEQKAIELLLQADDPALRGLSAELNGLVGIYGGHLAPQAGTNDFHYLIATDTAQGKLAARLVRDALEYRGFAVNELVPPGLSVANSRAFSTGVKNLMKLCFETFQSYKDSKYEVVFNLVGGFKTLQGYLSTIGMLLADEMVYIFEGEKAELIRIPKLPITLDESVIRDHRVFFALMASGFSVPSQKLTGIPETMLVLGADGRATLSEWGQLMWEWSKKAILTESLLEFPWLVYSERFKRDFDSQSDHSERVKLQETLAKVSGMLEESRGDVAPLRRDGGLQYENLMDKFYDGRPVGHFRVDQGTRISCVAYDGTCLKLLRYGHRNEVNDRPF